MLTMMALTLTVHAGEPSDQVREIERGTYVKTNVGTQFLFATHDQGPLFGANVATSIALGTDFVDRRRFSAAIEGHFAQTLYRGPTGRAVRDQTLSQGDLHSFEGAAVLEVSAYPAPRFGIGLRGGVGVAHFPLLADQDAFFTKIVPAMGGHVPLLHANGVWVQLIGGPSLEYYTKLAHFSVGADLDLVAIVGFDVGFRPSGYLKYTF